MLRLTSMCVSHRSNQKREEALTSPLADACSAALPDEGQGAGVETGRKSNTAARSWPVGRIVE